MAVVKIPTNFVAALPFIGSSGPALTEFVNAYLTGCLKKLISVNSGACLRRFDDVPGVVKTEIFCWAM